MSQQPNRKLLSRSVQQSSREKPPISSSFNNTSGVYNSRSNVNTSRNANNPNVNSYNSQEQKGMFYQQLRIQTHDKDVPLIKVLKVNQQILKKFVYHTSSAQNLIHFAKKRALSLGFRALAGNLLYFDRYHLKLCKLTTTFHKILNKRSSYTLTKLSGNKNSFRVKQRALLLVRRLILAKMTQNSRWFFRQLAQKKLMKIVLEKAEEDQLVKMKMSLEVLRQLTYSKEFTSKCRGLIKYTTGNGNSKNMFQKQLTKTHFLQCLASQLQRYQQIRKNVDNLNPTQVSSNNIKNRRKATQVTLYQNQIILSVIKSFSLYLDDVHGGYQGQVQELKERIEELSQEERYVGLMEEIKGMEQEMRLYEGVIGEMCGKGDEEIRKVVTGSDIEVVRKRLESVITAQMNRYIKSSQKQQKVLSTSNTIPNQHILKLYKSRCFNLQLYLTLIASPSSLQLYKQLFTFLTTNLTLVIKHNQNPTQLKSLVQKLTKTQHTEQQLQQGRTIIVNLGQVLMGMHDRLRLLIEEKDGEVQRVRKQLEVKYQEQLIKYKQTVTDSNSISISKSVDKIERHNSATKGRKTSLSKIQPSKSQQKQPIRKQLQHKPITKQPQPIRSQPIKPQPIKPQPIKQQPSLIKKPSLPTSQPQPQSYKVLFQVIRNGIIQYIQSVTNNYSSNKQLKLQNQYIKKALLPQSRGRTRLQQNIQMNAFTNQLNSQILSLIKHLQQQISTRQQQQKTTFQLQQLITLFYQQIVSSSTTTKQSSSSNNTKWTQLCKSLPHPNRTSLINTFNELIVLFKQLSSSCNKQKQSPSSDFTEELKKILKDKLEWERKYSDLEKMSLVRQEEYNIVKERQKENYQKITLLEKELNGLRFQKRLWQEKDQKSTCVIDRLKQQLQVYMTSARTQAQQNNKLNRQLNRLKLSNTTLQQQVQKLKLKLTQSTTISNNTTTTNNQHTSTFTLQQFHTLQTTLNIKITQLQHSLSLQQSLRSQHQKSLNDLRVKLSQVQGHNDQLRFAVKLIEQQLAKLRDKQAGFIKVEELYQTQINELTEGVTRGKQQIVRLQSVIAQYQRNQLTGRRQKQQLQGESQVQKQRLLKQMQKLSVEIVQFRQTITRLRQQLASRDKTIAQLTSQHHSNINSLKKHHQLQTKKISHQHQSQLKLIQLKHHSQQSHLTSLITQLQLKLSHSSVSETTPLPNTSTASQPRLHILSFDPQHQIQSLKQYILTIQQQNQKLSRKYNKLKKQLWADDTSTTVSHKGQNHTERQFYEVVVAQLKQQNQRLYAEILKLKRSNSTIQQGLGITDQQSYGHNINDDFWVLQIKRKQSIIQQHQRTILQLRQQLITKNQHYQALLNNKNLSNNLNNPTPTPSTQTIQSPQPHLTITTLQHQLHQLTLTKQQQHHHLSTKVNYLQQQLLSLQSQYQTRIKQHQLQQSYDKVNYNYSQLLQSTHQVKELFTKFIQATNHILQQLDRTEEHNLAHQGMRANFNCQSPKNSHVSQSPSESILQLIQEFKIVIENNHETLKSIYQNLVCHPYTKTALQLQYLKQLTFNVIQKFYLCDQEWNFTNQLRKEDLEKEINDIFDHRDTEGIKPIEEVFVRVEELVVGKIEKSLDRYKYEMNLKAMELQYLSQKLNLIIGSNLTQQQLLASKLPHTRPHIHPPPIYSSPPTISHNNPFRPTSPQPIPHNTNTPNPCSNLPIRPQSNTWISKTTSNYEYRPLTTLIDKYDLMAQEKLDEGNVGIQNTKKQEGTKPMMYRSDVNVYWNKETGKVDNSVNRVEMSERLS